MEFSEDQANEIRDIYKEHLPENETELTLKEVLALLHNTLGIKNYTKEEILEYLKEWNSKAIVEVTEKSSSLDIHIDFDTFLRLLGKKVINKKSDIGYREIIKNIQMNPENDTLSIAELKYYFETKLGEKLSDGEMRIIFSEVTSEDEISVDDLEKVLKEKFKFLDDE